MVNFDTDKLLIILYPIGSGGNFLSNCMALSNDVLFDDKKILEYQLLNKITSKDKFTILRNRIRSTNNKEWKDFFIDSFWNSVPEDLDKKNIEEYCLFLNSNEYLNKITNSNAKYFFFLPHFTTTYNKSKSIWKNSKSIIFKNSLLFVLIRGCHRNFKTYLWINGENNLNLKSLRWKSLSEKTLKSIENSGILVRHLENFKKKTYTFIWNNLRKDNWPKSPPLTIKEYINYDDELKIQIQNAFNNYQNGYFTELENYYNDFIDKFDFVWDTNWFFDRNKTANGIRELYKYLNISDYNEEYILTLYDEWIEKNEPITLYFRKNVIQY